MVTVNTGAASERDVGPIAGQVLLRLMFWPLVLLWSVVTMPASLIMSESKYMAQEGDESQKNEGQKAKIVLARITHAWNQSIMFLYQVTLYNFFVGVSTALCLPQLFSALEDVIERFIGIIFCGFYKTKSGDRYPFSLVNCFDPTFEVPTWVRYRSKSFPQKPLPGTDERDAAQIEASNGVFFAVLSKLAYEHVAVVSDVVKNKLRLQLQAHITVGMKSTKSLNNNGIENLKFRPNTYAFVASTSDMVVVSFKGTSPLDLIDYRSDVTLAMLQNDLGGVHAGFYNELFSNVDGPCVFDQIVQVLNRPENQNKIVYLTGHSLGAALASVFAAAAATRQQGISLRIGGIYTIGQPRCGDRIYRAQMNENYQGRYIRFVNSNDIVTESPLGLGYRHHSSERYITWRADELLATSKKIKQHSVWEDFNALLLSLASILESVRNQESILRLMSRVALFFLPGLSNHFPCDYEEHLTRISRPTARTQH